MKYVNRPPDRHPYEYFLLIVSAVFSGLDLLDLVPTPASIRQQVPGAAWLWSGLLFVGSVTALVSLFWPRKRGVTNFTALLVEQVGLVTVGVTTVFYGAVILINTGVMGAQPALMNIGFGTASITQAFLIQRYIRDVHELLQSAHVVEEEAAAREDEGDQP